MSASSKKKLRREQEAAQLTEKQLTAQKEANKLKLQTTAFVVVMVALLVIAVTVGISNTITNSGMREKNSTALTVGDHQISSAEMNYFYMDAVNNFYSQYGSYASLFGLDTSKPLNEQIADEENGTTWADDFMTAAETNAKTVYALADAAKAAGFELTNEQITEVEYNIHNIDAYASLYGYADGDGYLKAMYGNGATVESYLEYAKLTELANSYYNHYAESLTYEEADLRAVDADNFGAYSSYAFNSYYMAVSKFATPAEAEEAAKALTGDGITSVQALDEAIAALPINADTAAVSTANAGTLATSLNTVYADWITDSTRKAGDKAYFPSSTTDAEGNATVSGYYVIFFNGVNDNTDPTVNVRHILVTPEHVHVDGETHAEGETYSSEEMAAAKIEAEGILNEWKSGDATEESFAELANSKSDDGDGTTGGLYENVYPGQMVVNFNDWIFDETRKAGDTDIVETEYGYHVMYFVGESDKTYRDMLIENDLRAADLDAWYNETVESMTVTRGETKYLSMDLVLAPTEAAEETEAAETTAAAQTTASAE